MSVLNTKTIPKEYPDQSGGQMQLCNKPALGKLKLSSKDRAPHPHKQDAEALHTESPRYYQDSMSGTDLMT